MIQPLNCINFGGKFLNSKIMDSVLNKASDFELSEFNRLKMKAIRSKDGINFSIFSKTTFAKYEDMFQYIGLMSIEANNAPKTLTTELLRYYSRGDITEFEEAIENGILAPLRKMYD